MVNYHVDTNKAVVCGMSFVFIPHHKSKDTSELFYESTVSVQRMNDSKYDTVPIMVPESLLTDELKKSTSIMIMVKGKIKSFNESDGSVSLFILASSIEKAENGKFFNRVRLTGSICKTGMYKRFDNNSTLFNFIIVTKGYYNKKNYIPVIAWNEYADEYSKAELSSFVRINGYFQSRKYIDKDGKESSSYEICVYDIKEVSNNGK